MARNFITYIVWMVVLIQRVAILQMNELWTNTFYLITIQIIFIVVILYIRGHRELEGNKKLGFIALGIFGMVYLTAFYSLMYSFYRAQSFDIILLTMIVVLVTNYELLFYRGYEVYTVDWRKRLTYIVPLAIISYIIYRNFGSYIIANPIYFTDTVVYNGEYFTGYRNIGINYITLVQFILTYAVYKLDFILCVIPKKPTTTDFWIKFEKDISLDK